MSRSRVAVVGGGGAGLCTAWLLSPSHEVTLYEAATELGGHAKTVAVPVGDREMPVDTGFRYFHDRGFPTLLGLLRVLGLSWRSSPIGSTFCRAGRPATVMPPRSPAHVWRALREPDYRALLFALRRLGLAGEGFLAAGDWTVTFRDYARRLFPRRVAEELVVPYVAANWGAPIPVMERFPAMDVLGVLSPARGPSRFYEVDGGVGSYIRALATDCRGVELRLGCGVESIGLGDPVVIVDRRGESRGFDRVVIATEAYTAAALLGGDLEWSAALRTFEHFDAHVVVHRDPSYMPPERGDWTHVNVFADGRYIWMTEWTGKQSGAAEVFRTWLPAHLPPPEPVLSDNAFRHLVMTPESVVRQRRLAELQGRRGVLVAGMYTTGIDTHESALASALAVARRLAPESPNLERLARARRAA